MPTGHRHASIRIFIFAFLFASSQYVVCITCSSNIYAQEIGQLVVGEPGETIPFALRVPRQKNGKAQDRGIISILNLPSSFKLNRGFASGNSWFVSLHDTNQLTLSIPRSFRKKLVLTLKLIRNQKAVRTWKVLLAQKKTFDGRQTASVVTPSPSASATETKPVTSTKKVPLKQKPLTLLQRKLLERGDKLMASNDIAAARLLFTRLAHANVAEGAYKLAQTYDPKVLQTMPIAGLKPDTAMARKWYMRAAELGKAAAQKRISELDNP